MITFRKRWVHAVAEKGFAADTALYDTIRPSYPSKAIDWIVSSAIKNGGLHAPAQINCLELAAGTGKLTRCLLKHGVSRITPTEPLAEMRAEFYAKNKLNIFEASAENLSQFMTHSFDLVAIGQAFHWFANSKALVEIGRVLKPGGTLALAWNLESNDTKWVADVRQIWEAYDNTNPTDQEQYLNIPQYRKGTWINCFSSSTDHPFHFPQRRFFKHFIMTTPNEIWLRAKSKSYIATLPIEKQNQIQADMFSSLNQSVRSGLIAFDQRRPVDNQLCTALPLLTEVAIATSELNPPPKNKNSIMDTIRSLRRN